MQRDPRTMKGVDTSPAGKAPGLQNRDSNVTLKEKSTNVLATEARPMAYSQTFGNGSLNVQPLPVTDFKRSSTFGKTSQIFQLHQNVSSFEITRIDHSIGYQYQCL